MDDMIHILPTSFCLMLFAAFALGVFAGLEIYNLIVVSVLKKYEITGFKRIK